MLESVNIILWMKGILFDGMPEVKMIEVSHEADHIHLLLSITPKMRVLDAIRSSQKAEITYPQFLESATKTEAVSYTVFITGRQVPYFGAKGEMYIEHFPDSF